MDARLEQLDSLSPRPSMLLGQIEAARRALCRHHPLPPHVEGLLSSASLLAEIAISMAGSWWQLGVTWLTCFAGVRLLISTWDLPPGPWWNWGLLLGFDARSLTAASILLISLVTLPIMACHLAGKIAHRSLGGHTGIARHAPLAVAAILLALAIGLVSCSGRERSQALSSCGNAWQPQALGQGWWLLRCPDDAHSPGCPIDRGDAHGENVAAGQRVIVPASQLLRIDFLASPRECASKVHLVRLEGVALPVSVTAPPLKFEPPNLSLSPTTLSFDIPTLLALHELSGSLTRLSQRMAKVVAGFPRKDDGKSPDASAKQEPGSSSDLPSLTAVLQTNLPLLVSELRASNGTASAALRLRAICQTLRDARGAGGRMKLSAGGDHACIDAIDALLNKEPTK